MDALSKVCLFVLASIWLITVNFGCADKDSVIEDINNTIIIERNVTKYIPQLCDFNLTTEPTIDTKNMQTIIKSYIEYMNDDILLRQEINKSPCLKIVPLEKNSTLIHP